MNSRVAGSPNAVGRKKVSEREAYEKRHVSNCLVAIKTNNFFAQALCVTEGRMCGAGVLKPSCETLFRVALARPYDAELAYADRSSISRAQKMAETMTMMPAATWVSAWDILKSATREAR